METNINELITIKSFSLKIKNKLKLEHCAKTKGISSSAYINKLIEDIKQ
jgi:hypothetical protein